MKPPLVAERGQIITQKRSGMIDNPPRRTPLNLCSTSLSNQLEVSVCGMLAQRFGVNLFNVLGVFYGLENNKNRTRLELSPRAPRSFLADRLFSGAARIRAGLELFYAWYRRRTGCADHAWRTTPAPLTSFGRLSGERSLFLFLRRSSACSSASPSRFSSAPGPIRARGSSYSF